MTKQLTLFKEKEEPIQREGSASETRQALLSMHLAAAVPVEIAYIKAHGGITPEMQEAAKLWRQDTRNGAFADESLFHHLPGSATQMARLTECLAILAFEEDGVRAFGSHFLV